MSTRRSQFHNFYAAHHPSQPLRIGTPALDRYAFRGNGVRHTVVVRADLNGYSEWARDNDIPERAALLSEFFANAVLGIETAGGVYYREEGDCVVALFSDYFGLGATHQSVGNYLKQVVGKRYGNAGLSAKALVAMGNVAYFQKAHEVGTNEWSAEGHPFVAAARLEAAIESRPRYYFFADDYDAHFRPTETFVATGVTYHWHCERESTRVAGLGLQSGWADVVHFEHLPSGRTQS